MRNESKNSKYIPKEKRSLPCGATSFGFALFRVAASAVAAFLQSCFLSMRSWDAADNGALDFLFAK